VQLLPIVCVVWPPKKWSSLVFLQTLGAIFWSQERWAPGAKPDILILGATGGASFATRGAVNGLCLIALNNFNAVAWRHAENFGRPLGGPGKIFGGSVPPWHPPSSAPVGRPFAQIFRDFAKIFRDFVRIYRDFAQIFRIVPTFTWILPGFLTNQNFWGCACTPCTPASYTTACGPTVLPCFSQPTLALKSPIKIFISYDLQLL